MPTFEEMLKANGATEEDLKILNHPAARKAYEKQQAEIEAERNRYAAKDKELKDYHGTVTSYYEESDAKLKAMQNKVVSSQAEAERFRGALVAARDEGLIQVAENLLTPPKVDPAKLAAPEYINRDDFLKAADQLGDNLARLEDMVMEHRQLFPDTPLRVSDLRREALAARKNVPEYWEEKYRVRDARESQAKAAREAEQAKWKAEGAKEKETELISRGFNPDTRPLMPSTNPFVPRKKADDGGIRAKQPWEQSDGALSNDRVRHVTEKLVKQQFSN